MSDYVTVRRKYQHGSVISPILADLVTDRATLVRPLLGIKRMHYWYGSPIKEVVEVPGKTLVPDWWAELQPTDNDSPGAIFGAVCGVIEKVWDRDRFHVVFHSSGYDSRILSSAIKWLATKNGRDWLGPGLLFLGNRWEADGARAVLRAQGWEDAHIAMYEDGRRDDHFLPWLDFADYWRTAPAPTSLPGNLWWYLPDWAQRKGLLPEDSRCQAFAGYWANETWQQWVTYGPAGWLKQYKRLYHHIMAALRFKLPMEFPLSHPDVLRLVSPAFKLDGNALRKAVADYACPEARHIKNMAHHDHKWPISKRLRDQCRAAYDKSWYGCHVKPDWRVPEDSRLDNAWLHWSMASLCEELIRRGVDVRAK